MQSVLLASESPIKISCVKEFFPSDKYKLTTIKCDECTLPVQPLNCTEQCAKLRLNYAKSITYPQEFDYYIAIENGIEVDAVDEYDLPRDICIVFIEHRGILGYSDIDVGFSVPTKYYKQLSGLDSDRSRNIQGFNTTIGDVMHKYDSAIDPKNWVKSHHGVCRSAQIKSQIEAAQLNLSTGLDTALILRNKYKLYDEYPLQSNERKTINHVNSVNTPNNHESLPDFFSLLREYEDIQRLLYLLADQYRFDAINYVVGPESKGFFGFGLACILQVGFIPIRNEGKLPGKVVSLTYQNGSSINTIEFPGDIKQGSRVIIFDDLIASGTSLRAAYDIINHAGCTVIDCLVLREIFSLRDEAQKKMGIPYKVLLQ